ncbi:MAG: TetR/AcrR family transcriptional regulator [Mycobacteriales bacterium]
MTSAGRPRDPRVDEALRRVVQDLLVEQGYGALTVQGVARAAGVSPATIYRRFPGKRELVEWAAFPASEWVEPRWTGDYAADLTTLVEVLLSWLRQPAVRSAVPGLLGEYVRDITRYEALLAATVEPVRRSLAELVARAVERGEAVEGVSLPALLDVILGAVLLEAMVSDGAGVRAAAERIADVVRRATT